MGFLDGKYWIVYGIELLGVTTDESKVEKLLQDAYLEENNLPESDRARMSLKLKFETYTLVVGGLPVNAFYATNAPEL